MIGAQVGVGEDVSFILVSGPPSSQHAFTHLLMNTFTH